MAYGHAAPPASAEERHPPEERRGNSNIRPEDAAQQSGPAVLRSPTCRCNGGGNRDRPR